MTHEALELLATGLKSFMDEKTIIDDVVFDQISREARFLSNRKLSEQCKMAKRRCSETRHLLQSRLDCLARKQLEVASTDSPSTTSHSATHNTLTAEACRLDCRLHSSQSAPATPALTAKSNARTELKRRSQSLDDDITGELLQELEASQSTSTYSSTTSSDTTTGEYHSLEEAENESVDEKFADVPACAATPQFVLPTLVDDLELDSSEERFETDSQRKSSTSDCDSVFEESSNDSISSGQCHTVYRGDKFLEMADVTIPLDEDLHLNNNHLFIQSPTIENGHVIYAPVLLSDAELIAAETSSVDTIVPQPSAGSDTAVEDSPKVQFDIMATDNGSCDEEPSENVPEISTSQTDLLTKSPTVVKTDSIISPVLSVKQKQKAMQKRKSFHGFTSAFAQPFLNFTKNWKITEDIAKRHSVSEVPTHMERDGCMSCDHEDATLVSPVDCSFTDKETSRLLKVKRMDKTMSLITSSSDSLPR